MILSFLVETETRQRPWFSLAIHRGLKAMLNQSQRFPEVFPASSSIPLQIIFWHAGSCLAENTGQGCNPGTTKSTFVTRQKCTK